MEEKMSEKRDYYEVLGVSKNATDEELKRHIEGLQKNTILMQIQTIKKKQRQSLKK